MHDGIRKEGVAVNEKEEYKEEIIFDEEKLKETLDPA